MVEQKQILTLLVVTFIIGVAGIAGVYLARAIKDATSPNPQTVFDTDT
jgi:hypothetical protein